MSYYFPLGAAEAATVQNISHSLVTTTASVPLAITISALSASFVTTTGSIPLAGTNGENKTSEICGSSTISGSTGPQGPTGSNGTNNITCPNGTIECTALNVSLSMALPGFPNGINFIRPSGSKFSKVCMEIPPGCTIATAVCPSFLPTASITATYPSIS